MDSFRTMHPVSGCVRSDGIVEFRGIGTMRLIVGTADAAMIAGPNNAATRIEPRYVLRSMLLIAAFLTAAGIAVDVTRGVFGHNHAFGFVRLFDLDQEGNIPSFYSAVALLFSAPVLFLISKAAPPDQKRPWIFLSALFVYLAVDEAAGIHEMTIRPMRSVVQASGIWFYGWVIFAIPILAALAVAFIPFVLKLPTATKGLMIAAASILVFGAVGMEMIGAPYAEQYGQLHLLVKMISNAEEFVEMIGVSVWNYALLCHLQALLQTARGDRLVIAMQ